MDPFPYPLFGLICSSLCISTVTLIFATLIINVSPALWIFPAAFIVTVAFHAITLLISSAESTGSARLFSLANLVFAYALTGAWLSVFGISLALSVLKAATAPRGSWSMIVPCVCSCLESIVMGFIAARTQKERTRILYAAKWKWRPGHGTPMSSSQWSIVPR